MYFKVSMRTNPVTKRQKHNGHMHLGLLAYWVVNTVRHKLKKKGIHRGWRGIVRSMNTQKFGLAAKWVK